MKLISFLLIIVVLSSCSKEVRINNHLNGKWKLESIDEQLLPADETMITSRLYVFEKTGKQSG